MVTWQSDEYDERHEIGGGRGKFVFAVIIIMFVTERSLAVFRTERAAVCLFSVVRETFVIGTTSKRAVSVPGDIHLSYMPMKNEEAIFPPTSCYYCFRGPDAES